MPGKGIGGHQSAAAITETWLTPPEVIASLTGDRAEFSLANPAGGGHQSWGDEPFELDPCAAPSPRPWPTALRHLEYPHVDGLKEDWGDYRVWLNPPYGSSTGKWLSRLADHGHGCALIFARTETEMFTRYVFKRADAILFMEGRLHFHHPDGTRAKANSGAPSVIAAYGEQDVERLIKSGLRGHVMPLKPAVMVHLLQRQLAAMDAETPRQDGLTWDKVVFAKLTEMGGRASLRQLYDIISETENAQRNSNWKAKVRQVVNRLPDVRRVGEAEYAIAQQSPAEIRSPGVKLPPARPTSYQPAFEF